VTELEPRLTAYKMEMASVRDTLYADLLKGTIDWKVPSLSIASFGTLGFGPAVAAFLATVAGNSAKPVIDHVK